MQESYGINPAFSLKFIYNGKVLSDATQVAKLGLGPMEAITVMAEQAGSAPVARKASIEADVKKGLNEDQFNDKYGEDLLKDSLLFHYGVSTLSEAKVKMIEPYLGKYLQQCITQEEIISKLENKGYKLFEGSSNDKKLQLDGYMIELFGLSYDEKLFELSGKLLFWNSYG